MAVVGIVDDAGETVEWVRVRDDRITIGRSEGDIRIPHDSALSSLHAEIVRTERKGRPTWIIRDLNSTNGTFVRTASAILRNGQEFLIGIQRFRASEAAAAAPSQANADLRSTMGWQKIGTTPAAGGLCLIRIRPTGEEPCLTLQSGEFAIGSDPQRCAVVIQDDPFVSPVHAKLLRDPKERWIVENSASLNGLWARIDEMPVESYCEFLAGEQRFILRIPWYENPPAH
jgi:pSer/pThr/pTyr-binding forkhead associated (FHA) protein